MEHRTEVLVVGAGMAGLGAMHALAGAGRDFLAIEARRVPGGLARTETVGGFHFDQAGHFLHVRDERFGRAVSGSGLPLAEHERRASVMIGDSRIPYPIQFNLHAAPPELRRAALAELDGAGPRRGAARNLEEQLLQAWGQTLFDAFFGPYNMKLWRRPLAGLPPDCCGRYMPAPDAALVRAGAEAPIDRYGYNSGFLYPASGRMGDLPAALARPFSSRIRYGARLLGIDLSSRICRTSEGAVRFDSMVCTIALPELLAMLGSRPAPALDLASSNIAVLGLGVVGADVPEDHWIYIPDADLPFHRINFTRRVGAAAEVEGGQSVLVECGIDGAAALPDGEAVARRALRWLAEMGIMPGAELAVLRETTIRPAYIVHRQEGRPGFAALRGRLSEAGLWLAGRYGRWDYFSMEESFLSGMEAAEGAVAGRPEHARRLGRG